MKKGKVAEDQPIKQLGNWKVMEDGTVKGPYTNPAGITSELTIYADKLTDKNLLLRLYIYQAVAKSEWYDFMNAIFAAYSALGIQEIVVCTSRE